MGTGGGIITKKLLFAVLLIFGLSLVGISASSAADVGNAKTQNSNVYHEQKNMNTHVYNVNIFNNKTKTQKKVNKSIKFLKNENNTNKIITQNANHVNVSKKTHHTDTKKKVVNTPKDPKSLKTKNSVYNNSTNVSDKQIITTNIQKNVPVKKTPVTETKNSNNTDKQVNTTQIVKSEPVKKTPVTVTKKSKKYKAKKWYKYHGKWKYKWVYVNKNSNSSKYQYAAAGSTKTVVASASANTSSVKALASSLTKGTTSSKVKATKIFNWVRDHINYTFYYNTRYGASGTLKYKKGNCVDHSHLIVALARSAGLQARYVHAKAHFTSGHWYGHVWAQILVNGKWLTADATSSRNSLGVARNWNSATIKGIYNTLPF